MTYPRCSMYGAVNGEGFPFIEQGALVQSRIDAAAKYDDLILDLAAVEAFPQIKTALRAAGHVRLHAYQVMATWNNPNGPKLWQDIWKMVNATGGLLTVMPAGCPNINVANRATMDGLASLILHYAAGWDGVFVDVLIPSWQSGAGFDWRGMGFASEQAFLDAWKANALAFVQRLKGSVMSLGGRGVTATSLAKSDSSQTPPRESDSGPAPVDSIGVNDAVSGQLGVARQDAFAAGGTQAATPIEPSTNPRGFAGSVDPPLRHTATGSPRVSGGQESGDVRHDAQGSGAGASPTRQPTGAVGPLSGKLGAGDSASPPPFIVTTNYGIGFPGVADGNMYEEFERDWPRWIESTMEGELHLGHPAAWITSAPSQTHEGHYDATLPGNQRHHRFGLATACLFGGFHSFGRYEGDKQWQRDRYEPGWFFPEYSHPQRGKGWLGEPTEAAHQSRSDRFIWMRAFQHGLVVVNTDPNQAHSIYLPARYRPIGGPVKDGWSIPKMDALILEAV